MFILRKHYKELKHDFLDYFPQLMDYVKSESELFDKELKMQ
jgi:acyl carrier protein phosphodiesterase